MENNNQCKKCSSTRLVWDWANGDIVCTGCGLVCQERFIDERASWKDYEDYTPISQPINSNILTRAKVLNASLFNGFLDNTEDIAKSVQEFCDQSQNKNIPKKANIASGIYANTKGLSIKELCREMKVKTSHFWKASVQNKIQNNSNRTKELLKRTIYSCEYIPKNSEWNVFKIANKFLEEMIKTPCAQKIKPNRLVISLMIIACEIEKLPIIRQSFCEKYQLSLDTLKKHEMILQQVLKGSNKK